MAGVADDERIPFQQHAIVGLQDAVADLLPPIFARSVKKQMLAVVAAFVRFA
ncbi:hypothetical protein D9M71_743140 [compost metagenome]